MTELLAPVVSVLAVEKKKRTREQQDRKNEYKRAWRAASPIQRAKDAARCKQWNASHPDYQKKWRTANPKSRKGEGYRRLYGLTREAFDTLFAVQGGRCGICRRTLVVGDRKTHIDHDHASGRVRGILCNLCNAGMGMLGDSLDGLTAAVDYLRRGK